MRFLVDACVGVIVRGWMTLSAQKSELLQAPGLPQAFDLG